MKITKYVIASLVFLSFVAVAKSSEKSIKQQVEYYVDRYNALCTDQKITDNFGKGYPALYGTRNMRPILHGVAYRGGANNYYHTTNKRDNQNPLPPDGLENLFDEGFSDVVYLYAKNFSTAEKKFENENRAMNYHQITGNSRTEIKQIIQMVYDVISRKIQGPLYLHCWNGWHQSGYVASAILKQFCGYSDDEAFDYWMRNTDGANRGYNEVKQRVRDFKPFDEFSIDKELQELLCPCRGK